MLRQGLPPLADVTVRCPSPDRRVYTPRRGQLVRKLHDDLCDLGEDISPNRAWRLARLAGISAQIGYKKKPGSYGGSPALVADNTLNREFDVDAPDPFWVTEITYIRTHEGFLYFAVVIDLFSRRVVGWSMQGRTYTDLPLQALLIAVWRRKPKAKVQVHSPSRPCFA